MQSIQFIPKRRNEEDQNLIVGKHKLKTRLKTRNIFVFLVFILTFSERVLKFYYSSFIYFLKNIPIPFEYIICILLI